MESKRSAWKTFSRVGIGYTTFLITGFVLQIIAVLSGFAGEILSNSWLMVAFYFLHYGICGWIIYLILKDLPVSWKPRQNIAKKSMLFVAFLIAMSALYLGNLAGQVVIKILSMLFRKNLINPIDVTIQGLSLWAVFIIMVLLAPICEELIFRKLLIDRIRQYGDRTAIIVSAAIFGLCHGNFYQFFYAFGIGVVFAYVYIRTGRIRYTIWFHMMINFLGSVAVLLVSGKQTLTTIYSLIIFCMSIAGFILISIYKTSLILEPGMERDWGKGIWKSILLNVGMILFFAACVTKFIISEIGKY